MMTKFVTFLVCPSPPFFLLTEVYLYVHISSVCEDLLLYLVGTSELSQLEEEKEEEEEEEEEDTAE